MNNYYETVKQCVLFDSIDETQLSLLLPCMQAETKKFSKSSPVFMSGERTGYIGVVLNGSVCVENQDYYGNTSILSSVEKGGMFGQTYAFSGEKTFPVSIVALCDCEIMFFKYEKITKTCKNACTFHHTLIYNMLKSVSKENITLEKKINVTSKRTTRQKLLTYLSEEAKKCGNNQFLIPYNRQQLADYLCVDRSAMCNELSKLRADKIISFYKNSFKLLKNNVLL